MPIPGVTDFALDHLLAPESAGDPVTLTGEGHLIVRVTGEVMTRTDALLLCSQNLGIRPLNLRMQGRSVPEVFQRLQAMEGEGHLVLSREHETFHVIRLQRDLCFFVERFLWVLDAALMWDVGVVPASRAERPIPLVRASGEGIVVLRVPGELVAIKIAPERPQRVRSEGFVGWVGNVVPHAERDVPFVYCEGEGAVFVSLPNANAAPGESGQA